MSSDRRAVSYAIQCLVVLVGIVLGIIPLVGLVVGRGPGVLAPLIGETGRWAVWWVPATIIVVCVAIIAVVERLARR